MISFQQLFEDCNPRDNSWLSLGSCIKTKVFSPLPRLPPNPAFGQSREMWPSSPHLKQPVNKNMSVKSSILQQLLTAIFNWWTGLPLEYIQQVIFAHIKCHPIIQTAAKHWTTTISQHFKRMMIIIVYGINSINFDCTSALYKKKHFKNRRINYIIS